MIKIHKEGRAIILQAGLVIGILLGLGWLLIPVWLFIVLVVLFLGLFGGIVFFFRHPCRAVPEHPTSFLSPADGTIVVVEEVHEGEFFGSTMKQVSVFMSPVNVHVNRYPIGGKVRYTKYHPGRFLVAWHPKCSHLNERMSVALETTCGKGFMVRQIAGFLARRIISYAIEDQNVHQGEEMGFIRFGSRVDLFLPMECQVHVKPGEKVRGGVTPLASI